MPDELAVSMSNQTLMLDGRHERGEEEKTLTVLERIQTIRLLTYASQCIAHASQKTKCPTFPRSYPRTQNASRIAIRKTRSVLTLALTVYHLSLSYASAVEEGCSTPEDQEDALSGSVDLWPGAASQPAAAHQHPPETKPPPA